MLRSLLKRNLSAKAIKLLLILIEILYWTEDAVCIFFCEALRYTQHRDQDNDRNVYLIAFDYFQLFLRFGIEKKSFML